MSIITISIKIFSSSENIWNQISDIESHTSWMADAETITITSEQKQGVGTTFDCETKVGPFRLTDRMEITDWTEGLVMGVAHSGVVTGKGHFTLESIGDNETLFSWEETLYFPWWMGGSIGALIARPVLKAIWNVRTRCGRNLADFRNPFL